MVLRSITVTIVVQISDCMCYLAFAFAKAQCFSGIVSYIVPFKVIGLRLNFLSFFLFGFLVFPIYLCACLFSSVIQTNLFINWWQKVLECTNRSAELLKRSTANDAETALEVIAEAVVISSYSERLLEMKAEALFMVCSSFSDAEKVFFEEIEFYRKSVVSSVLTSVSSGSSGNMMR